MNNNGASTLYLLSDFSIAFRSVRKGLKSVLFVTIDVPFYSYSAVNKARGYAVSY